MNTIKRLLLIAATLTTLFLKNSLRAAPTPGSSPGSGNLALLSSPRTLEEFPALARGTISSDKITQQTSVTMNRAFVASPRAQEEFPELTRMATPRAVKNQLAGLGNNRALRATPRILEEFPALARGGLVANQSPDNQRTPSVVRVSR